MELVAVDFNRLLASKPYMLLLLAEPGSFALLPTSGTAALLLLL